MYENCSITDNIISSTNTSVMYHVYQLQRNKCRKLQFFKIISCNVFLLYYFQVSEHDKEKILSW